MNSCEQLIYVELEDDGTPCGEPADRQIEGQWLCDKHFDLADRLSKQHWSEGLEIEEAI